MKKVLLVVALGGFVACNNNTTSIGKEVDSLNKATVDSLKNASDSVRNVIDSTRIKL